MRAALRLIPAPEAMGRVGDALGGRSLPFLSVQLHSWRWEAVKIDEYRSDLWVGLLEMGSVVEVGNLEGFVQERERERERERDVCE